MIRRRREAERAAQRAERARAEADRGAGLFRALLDSAAQGIVLVDSDGSVRVANDAARLLLGTGGPVADLGPLVAGVAAEAQARGGEAVEERELRVPHRRSLVLRGRPVAEGVAVLVDDVTEPRRAAQVRRDFVANVSHELRTPVSGIALLAEQLAAALRDDPDAAERFAGRMHEEALRLSTLIGDLLDLSRIESDLPLAVEELEAASLLKEAASRVTLLAEARRVTLTVRAGDGLRLTGDGPLLSAALTNLLDNAVRYSDVGGSVVAGVDVGADEIRFVVEDHGAGIPTEDVDRIFERFYRVDRARARASGGTGLGLAIVKHVAERHGGHATCRSRLGEGSTFVLTLPREAGP